MKKVTSADTAVMINHYKNILEAEGIPCQVRNEHLNQIYGEMPFTEVWPELWVLHDIDYDRAKQLIDATIIDESPGSPWRCTFSIRSCSCWRFYGNWSRRWRPTRRRPAL